MILAIFVMFIVTIFICYRKIYKGSFLLENYTNIITSTIASHDNKRPFTEEEKRIIRKEIEEKLDKARKLDELGIKVPIFLFTIFSVLIIFSSYFPNI